MSAGEIVEHAWAPALRTWQQNLGLDQGDVQVLLRQLGEQSPDELAAFIRQAFDPHGVSTARPACTWPGVDPEPRGVYGLGGPDPNRLNEVAVCGITPSFQPLFL